MKPPADSDKYGHTYRISRDHWDRVIHLAAHHNATSPIPTSPTLLMRRIIAEGMQVVERQQNRTKTKR